MNSYEMKAGNGMDVSPSGINVTNPNFQFTDDPGRIHSSELAEYVTMLVDDDITQFQSMAPARRQKYFYGQFEYKSMKSCNGRTKNVSERLEVPFNIALGYCAKEIIKEYIRGGVDVMRVDVGYVNVFHVLAICASERYRLEDDYVEICDMLIEEVLQEDQFRFLCNQEDKDGLRPMELASKLGAFGIMRALLMQQGYICGQGRPKGMCTIFPYDISDYEDCQDTRRLIRSPLRYMVYLSQEGLASCSQYKIMELPVVRKWIKMKKLHSIFFLIIWWIFRLGYIMLISFADPNVSLYQKMCGGFTPTNNTAALIKSGNMDNLYRQRQCVKMNAIPEDHRNTMLAVVEFAWIWSCIMMIFDILEAVFYLWHKDRRHAYKKVNWRTRNFAIYTPSYRIAMFILYLLNVIAVPVSRSISGGAASRMLLNMKAMQLPLCLMGFLYVVEFLPVLGLFAVTLQRMIQSMVVFMVFLIPVKVLFTSFFMFFDATKRFAEIGTGVYHLFMMDMGSIDFGENPRLLTQVVHVFYFLVMLILLFNYLIAVLSLVAEDVGSHKRIYVELRRLQMIHHVEERFTFWLWKYLIYKYIRERRPVILYATAPLPERE